MERNLVAIAESMQELHKICIIKLNSDRQLA